jgi:hypothetical protein
VRQRQVLLVVVRTTGAELDGHGMQVEAQD